MTQRISDREANEADRAICEPEQADGIGGGLGTAIARRFSALGGVELELAPREPTREPPSWPADAADDASGPSEDQRPLIDRIRHLIGKIDGLPADLASRADDDLDDLGRSR